jgi:two-component system, OmpR family, sensor histidine kinase KdpD
VHRVSGFRPALKPPTRRASVLVALAAAAICAGAGYAIASAGEWLALSAFVLAVGVATVAIKTTRSRAGEARQRRLEADLAVEMARLLLRGASLADSLPVAAARLAQVFELPYAAIHLGLVAGDERHIAFELCEGPRRLGTLVVPAGTPDTSLHRLQQRVVPALEALLMAAREREALQGEVVETAALRRADVVKTAVLRAVSHDLRSPLTAISTAGEALALEGLSARGHRELATVILEETRRLTRLVENVLDVSRLEAGAAEPRLEWTSVDEVIRVAVAGLAAHDGEFNLSVDSELPLVRADSAQLERAFVNVLENAQRHSRGQPVAVRARAVGFDVPATSPAVGRLIVRVVDRGPGIPPAELDRVFQPFYRGRVGGEHHGSGLGLAIARGFTEANGGTLSVESLPGQGATFVFELPLQPLRELAAQHGRTPMPPKLEELSAGDAAALSAGEGSAAAAPAPSLQ